MVSVLRRPEALIDPTHGVCGRQRIMKLIFVLSVQRMQSVPMEFAAWHIKLQCAVSETQHPREPSCDLDLMERHHQGGFSLPGELGQRIDRLKRPRRIE
jgi:hypothetical protein